MHSHVYTRIITWTYIGCSSPNCQRIHKKNRKKNEEGKKNMNKVRQSSGKKLLAIAALVAYTSVYIFIHGIYMSASVNHGNGLF